MITLKQKMQTRLDGVVIELIFIDLFRIARGSGPRIERA